MGKDVKLNANSNRHLSSRLRVKKKTIGAAGSKRSKTDQRIHATAALLFAERGFNGVSTREIASAAGVSEVTIYRHYGHKRELFNAVLEAEIRRMQLPEEPLLRLAKAQHARTALSQTFELIAETLNEGSRALTLLQYQFLELGDDLGSSVRAHLEDLLGMLQRYLERWVDRDELPCSNVRSLILSMISISVSEGSLLRIFCAEPYDFDRMFASLPECCAA